MERYERETSEHRQLADILEALTNYSGVERNMSLQFAAMRNIVASRLRDRSAASRLEMVPICCGGSLEFNASLRFNIPNTRGFYIIVNGGLVGFLQNMNSALFARSTAIDSSASSLLSGAQATWLSLEQVYDLLGKNLPGPRNQFPVLPFPSDTEEAMRSLLRHQLLFILCHELGHALAGHWRSSSSRALVIKGGHDSETSVTVINPGWRREYEADLVAIQLLSDSGRHLDALLFAVDSVFQYASLIEEVAGMESGSPRTHPPSLERRDRIVRGVGQGRFKFFEQTRHNMQALEAHVSEIAGWRTYVKRQRN